MNIPFQPRNTSERPERKAEPLTLTSNELLCGTRKIVIDHEGTEYTLQVTKQNKLLLTK